VSEVSLAGFDGVDMIVDLDPALPPQENAARYYDRAGRAERARDRLPDLIRVGEEKVATLAELSDRISAGTVTVSEIREALPERELRARTSQGDVVANLPYRVYRTSGGLEVRVGRGSTANDELTFRHSRPDDVWLHARDSAGAHVILRWEGQGAPPARDLQEAAALAALHSKARTSGSVPVDWTSRKYVRKPRKSPPGSVVPDRVKTVFVEPDPTLPDRLRE
jgi:predicted ribosome quality control (RQC) complex YloA/Tae2 family protein